MRKLFFGLAVIVLASCSSRIGESLNTTPNAGPCPSTGSLYNASRIVVMEGDQQLYSNIAYTGEIVDVRMFCRYVEDNPVRAELEIDFAFGQGDKGVSNTNDYTYWVAVTRRNGKVLAKERFAVQADFSDGSVTGASELIQELIIPRLDSSVSAANFEVIVGFELTEEQLEFNKQGRRFRLQSGE